MNREVALTFPSRHQQLAGILHKPSRPIGVGVVIVVGGGQYRVGSHRQFVNLARFLCDRGIAVFRFDVTGMGDSSGGKKEFDCLDEDIKAAIDTFLGQDDAVKNVLLWGLCDGASAAMMYGYRDERVAALVLVNPWMEQRQAKAKARITSYYMSRLTSRAFWHKALTFNLRLADSIREFFQELGGLAQKNAIKQQPGIAASYQERMYCGAEAFTKSIHVVLSGRDLIAREFELQLVSGRWQKIYRRDYVHVHTRKNSDHTFSELSSENWLKKKTHDICVLFEEQEMISSG